MSLPLGFYESRPPTFVTPEGAPLGKPGAELEPTWPTFLRAALIYGPLDMNNIGPNPAGALHRFPQWRLYAGPMPRSSFELRRKQVEEWAIGRGWFVASEPVPIVPNSPMAPWPWTSFHGLWIWETAEPTRYRVAVAPGFGGGRLIVA